MNTRESKHHAQSFSPARVAPPGKSAAFAASEDELDAIAAGSQASLGVNFAIALISLGVAFILTLTTNQIESDRLFYGYLIACINCLGAGVIMFAYWLKTRVSVGVTVAKIRPD